MYSACHALLGFRVKVLKALTGIHEFALAYVQRRQLPTDGAIEYEMDKIRLAQFNTGSEFAMHLVVLVLFVVLANWRNHTSSTMMLNCLPFSVCYSFLLLQRSYKVISTARSLSLLYHIAMAIALLRVAMMTNAPFFVVQNGVRGLGRLFVGVAFLNYRETLPINILHSLLVCVKFVQINDGPDANLTSQQGFVFCSCELLILLCIATILYLYETWVETYVATLLDLRASRSGHLAVRKMLSVLCDAEVHLNAERRIVEPSLKTAHLLASAGSPDGLAELEHKEFDDFVATESDRIRFQSFVTASMEEGSSSSGSESKESAGIRPATSLFVQLRSLGGVCFSAELFHVHIPDSTSSDLLGHFIGIRELDSTRIEQDSKKNATLASASTSSLLGSQARHSHGGNARSESGDSNSSSSSSSTNSHGRVRRSSKHSSSAGAEMPELVEISLQFDAFAERLPLLEFTLVFADADSKHGCYAPCLLDWLPRKQVSRFLKFIQDDVNVYVNRGGVEQVHEIGPFSLAPPSRLFDEDVLLRSAQTILELPEMPSSLNRDFKDMPLILRMQRIAQQRRRPARHMPPSTLHTVQEGAEASENEVAETEA